MSYYYLKNEEKNGLEIYFGGKPSEDILNRLKEAHWRWYPTKGCWYTKYSKEKENFAKEICSSSQPSAPESSSPENIPSFESSNPQPVSAPIVPPKSKRKYKASSLCQDVSIIKRDQLMERKLGIKDLSMYYYVTKSNYHEIVGEIFSSVRISKEFRLICTFYDNDGDIIDTKRTRVIQPTNFFEGFPFRFHIYSKDKKPHIRLSIEEL